MANLKLTRSKLEQPSLKGLLCSWHAINIMLLPHACGFVKSELLTHLKTHTEATSVLPSGDVSALDEGCELPKVAHLGGLLPAHLH